MSDLLALKKLADAAIADAPPEDGLTREKLLAWLREKVHPVLGSLVSDQGLREMLLDSLPALPEPGPERPPHGGKTKTPRQQDAFWEWEQKQQVHVQALTDSPAFLLWWLWRRWTDLTGRHLPVVAPDVPYRGPAAAVFRRLPAVVLAAVEAKMRLWLGPDRSDSRSPSALLTLPDEGYNRTLDALRWLRTRLEEHRPAEAQQDAARKKRESGAAAAPTPENNPQLIRLSAAAEFYSIPRSTLSKAARKQPGQPGYLWSVREGKKVFVRKADIENIARSRRKLGAW